MPFERSLAIVLSELFSAECLPSFLYCTKERMCADGVHVSDGEARVASVKSGLIAGGFSPCLDEYDAALNLLKVWRTERCVLREKVVYVGQESGAQNKLLSSSVLIRGKNNEKKEVRVGKVLLLTQCLMKEESEGKELVFMR